MAKQYDVLVTSYNVSQQQVDYAREKVKLDHLVNDVEDDYRNINGQYDAFVSVGILAHVGLNNQKYLSKVMDFCLKKQVRGLVHSIGKMQPGQINPWIVKRLFPGAETPSLQQMLT